MGQWERIVGEYKAKIKRLLKFHDKEGGRFTNRPCGVDEITPADAQPAKRCNSNFAGALGYSFEFPSLIKEGVLHGEKGVKGEPGWLQLDGAIPSDGRANIYANGLVGASEAAVGHRPPGAQYGYHIEVEFTDTSGRGRRVEGRPCTVTFTKKL